MGDALPLRSVDARVIDKGENAEAGSSLRHGSQGQRVAASER
jgi:hypothetical protein